MNTAFILAIIVLGALSAALGAMLAAARREAGHLRADNALIAVSTPKDKKKKAKKK